jgi:hypothetical protein
VQMCVIFKVFAHRATARKKSLERNFCMVQQLSHPNVYF